MSSWTSGYVADIEYTHGFYRELTPGLIRLSLILKGVAPFASGPVSYLELGFGQGLAINIHAASVPGDFWGTDFNPNQAAHAVASARAAGSGAHLFDLSFEELARRDDLPDFDVIALHGIWSWISDENRRVVVDLIRRRLKVGGAVYISYNTLPGWAAAMPLRHLMTLHAETVGSEAQGMIGRINGAIDFAKRVVDSNAAYFAANPGVKTKLEKIAEQNRNYLAHEYFNRDWGPMHFAELADWLSQAKVSFAASAHSLDHVDAINLSVAGQELLKSISHPILHESVRDYLVNQQFRRDIFVKGLRTLSPLEQLERLRDTRLALTTRAEDVELKAKGALGEGTLQESVYRPLLSALADRQYAPKTVAEVMSQPDMAKLMPPQLLQAITILVGAGHVHPAQTDAEVKAVRDRCRRLNKYLCERARSVSEGAYLASPVLGGAANVGRFQQLFLLGLAQGQKQPGDWAQWAWETLDRQGHRLTKEGKPLQTAEENLSALNQQAKEFADKRLTILRALEVA
jgi:hypothetical protein